jgi:hypothetical protein
VRAAVSLAGHTNACEVGHRHYPLDHTPLAVSRIQITAACSPEQLVHLVSQPYAPLQAVVKDLLRTPWRSARRLVRTTTGRQLT